MQAAITSADRLWKTFLRCLHIYSEINGEQRAAAFAYYALFSLIPLVALLLTFGSAFIQPKDVIHAIEQFAPIGHQQQEVIWSMVDQLKHARSSVSLASIAILLWSSLRFFQALVRAVNRAWHTHEIPWWQVPLKNLLMLGIIASALLIGLIAPALLQAGQKVLIAFEGFLLTHVPQLAGIHALLPSISVGRYLVGTLILFYSFSLLYMISPRSKIRFSQVWFSALGVAVLLQLLQNAFVSFLPRFVNYNAIYGTVGGLMALLLWVYLSGIVIILGACWCAAQNEISTKPVTPSNSGD